MKPSDQFPKRIVDPKAESIKEMMAQTPNSRDWVSKFANDMVASGKWERVWKKQGVKLVPAYRVRTK